MVFRAFPLKANNSRGNTIKNTIGITVFEKYTPNLPTPWFSLSGSSFARDLFMKCGTKAAIQKEIMMNVCKEPKMLLSVSKNLSFAIFGVVVLSS